MTDGSTTRSGPPLPWGTPDRLRDEGVVFGLLNDADGIQAVHTGIRAHFDARRHAVQREREALQARLDELVARRVDTNNEVERLDAAASASDAADAPSLARAAAGLVLALAVCAFNYPLLLSLLGTTFDATAGVAAGLLLTGLFGSALLYGRRPLSSWADRLRVASAPVATALLVVVWPLSDVGLLPALAAFAYLVVFFIAGGRATLRVLAHLDDAAQAWRTRRDDTQVRAEYAARATTLRTETLPAIDQEAHDVQQALLSLPSDEALDAEEAQTRALFDSEVALARAARADPEIAASAEGVLYPPDY
mgnify:FL=1